jgi:phosphopantetheinyl transferase
MPLVYQQDINLDTCMGIWHIQESEDFFLSEVGAPHRLISNPQKRLQHLAGRFLLKKMNADFPLNTIEITESGKPFIAEDAWHFSISHSGDFAMAAVSKRVKVGVDLERYSDKATRISHKFLSDAEKMLFENFLKMNGKNSTINHWHVAAWSVKEAIYKLLGNSGVDFIKHLQIKNIISQIPEQLREWVRY